MGRGGDQDIGRDLLPAAFLSYAHADEKDQGRISELRRQLEQHVSIQLGLEEFVIFQDRRDLVWGENWQRRIDQALGYATFLIVILSPSFFGSSECRQEAHKFLEYEAARGRKDRILPIRYIEPHPNQLDGDKLAIELFGRQHVDWTDLLEERIESDAVRARIIDCARALRQRITADNEICAVLQRPRAPSEDDSWLRLARIWSERAAEHRDMGHLDDALASLRRALEFEPSSSWLLTQRAIAYRAMKLFDEALADHDRAIKVDSANAWVLRERAVTYRAMRRYDDAIADHDKAVGLAPGDADELAFRAKTLESAERWRDAFNDRDRIVELRGDNPWSWADRGRCHRKLGQIDEALADYEIALQLAPDIAWIRIGRAGVYWDDGKYEEALADYGYVLAKEPGNADALIRRVNLLMKLGKLRHALGDLNRAVDAKPEDSYILTQRAIFYRRLAEQGINDIDDPGPED